MSRAPLYRDLVQVLAEEEAYVPIGFVISVTIPALVTAATVFPAPGWWTLRQLWWRLSLQANELQLIVAAWVVFTIALAAAQGDLMTPGGLAGIAIGLLTLIGLAIGLRRAMHAGPAAARALSEGLGDQWQASLSPDVTARLKRRRPWARLLLAPMAVRRRDVIRIPDVSYGPAGKQNLLDIYLPRNGTVTGSCLVYFHGGGYYSGRKNRESRALIYRLASQGWICVSANYRLARSAPYPAALVDAKRVVGWMRQHAATYGRDPSSIVVAGSSAGAHLAAMAALTPNVTALQPGFEDVKTEVSAAICLYGFYGSPQWVDCEPGAPTAPLDQVLSDAPPMFIAHGTDDSFVPISVAQDFVKQFRYAAPDRSLVYLELPGAQHTFDLYRSIRFQTVVEAIDAFTAYLASSRFAEPRAADRIAP